MSGDRCRSRSGWEGVAEVPVDGRNWPLGFAARTLGVPERDLRDLVRITGLQPAGTMPMAGFRRSGRNPRVYDATALVRLYDAVQKLSAELSGTPGED
jgi:hypothetical protein